MLGKVRTDSLQSVCSAEKFGLIHQDIRAGSDECRRSCENVGLCCGGADSNKYWEHGTFASAETQACRYRIKMVADVDLERLEACLGLAG
jgi:uncharacterized protein